MVIGVVGWLKGYLLACVPCLQGCFPMHRLRVLAMWCVPEDGSEANASYARAESVKSVFALSS